MNRSLFKRHFIDAAEAARDFARRFIEEPLPDEMRFRVHLNMSHDGNATPDFKLFPEDSSDARALELKGIDAEAVIEALWRDGFVPQWIDLMVVGETGDTSVLDVMACGRFIDDEQRLYYANTKVAPFGVKSPSLPVDYVEGARFSIYDRSSCWSRDDLERARRNAGKVWSLELHGPAFDDRTLTGALTFPRLEILELFGVPMTGAALRSLGDLPHLRHLRSRLGPAAVLAFDGMPVIETLETLSLQCLPPQLASVAALAAAAPSLRELTLGSSHRTHADGDLTFSNLGRLTLESPTIPSWVAIPSSLRWLSIHAPEATDDDVRRILARCPETLETLGLRGTPVSDRILDELGRLPALDYIDAVDTQITIEALRCFVASRPGIRCWPKVERS